MEMPTVGWLLLIFCMLKIEMNYSSSVKFHTHICFRYFMRNHTILEKYGKKLQEKVFSHSFATKSMEVVHMILWELESVFTILKFHSSQPTESMLSLKCLILQIIYMHDIFQPQFEGRRFCPSVIKPSWRAKTTSPPYCKTKQTTNL